MAIFKKKKTMFISLIITLMCVLGIAGGLAYMTAQASTSGLFVLVGDSHIVRTVQNTGHYGSKFQYGYSDDKGSSFICEDGAYDNWICNADRIADHTNNGDVVMVNVCVNEQLDNWWDNNDADWIMDSDWIGDNYTYWDYDSQCWRSVHHGEHVDGNTPYMVHVWYYINFIKQNKQRFLDKGAVDVCLVNIIDFNDDWDGDYEAENAILQRACAQEGITYLDGRSVFQQYVDQGDNIFNSHDEGHYKTQYYTAFYDWLYSKVEAYNTSIVAALTASHCSVGFDPNGGTGSMITLSVDANSEMTLPENTNFTYSGHSFVGWSTSQDANATIYKPNDKITITQDTTLYARWSEGATQYSVIFDANGGTGSMTVQSVDANTSVTLPECKYVKNGYTFVGWSPRLDNPSYRQPGSEVFITENTTFYAQWEISEASTIKVTFNSNGGTPATVDITDPMIMMYEQTQTLALPECPYVREGYYFAGWRDITDGTEGLLYKIGETNWTVTDGKTFNAEWTKKTIDTATVNFDANGGTGNMTAVSGSKGDKITLPTNTFTREGYVFKGWGTSAKYSTIAYIDNSEITLTENVILYAIWERKPTGAYVISFDANGGSGNPPIIICDSTKEVVVDFPDDFTKEGYVLTGWTEAIDGSGTVYAPGSSITAQRDAGAEVVFYAQWAKAEDTVTFTYEPSGASWSTFTQNVIKDTEATLAEAPARAGYTFLGWTTTKKRDDISQLTIIYPAGDKITASQDTTLYAQWQVNTYTIEYNANNGTGEMDTQTATYDETVKLTKNAFTRDGYTFAGWSSYKDGFKLGDETDTSTDWSIGTSILIDSYDDEAEVKNLAENGTVTLYAQWLPDTSATALLTLTFCPTDDEADNFTVKTAADKTFTFPSATAIKTGYELVGWTSVKGHSAEYSVGQAITPTKDKTYYGVWTKLSDNNLEQSIEVQQGATVTKENVIDTGSNATLVIDNPSIVTAKYERGTITFTGIALGTTTVTLTTVDELGNEDIVLIYYVTVTPALETSAASTDEKDQNTNSNSNRKWGVASDLINTQSGNSDEESTAKLTQTADIGAEALGFALLCGIVAMSALFLIRKISK